MQRRLAMILAQARVQAKFLPLPSPEVVRAATDERVLTSLVESVGEGETSDRLRALAERLLAERDPVAVVATLIAKHAQREPEPRDVPVIQPELNDKKARKSTLQPSRPNSRERVPAYGRDRFADAPQSSERYASAPRTRAPQFDSSSSSPFAANAPSNGKPLTGRPGRGSDSAENWGMFRVTWGQLQGADARRVLAVVCRRGGIRGADVGAIRIGPTASIIEVKEAVAAEFATRALQPDPQEPRIRITPVGAESQALPEPGARAKTDRGSPFVKGSYGDKRVASFPKKLKKFGRASA
jgi:ATP-dependent RNA helicase DeaD